MRRFRSRRSKLVVGAAVLGAAAIVAVNPAREAAALEYPGGWQDVELYQEVNGVPKSFVTDNQGPVGYRRGGCSGTLIGDGLYLTVAHCIFSGEQNNYVRFGFQLNPAEELRAFDSYDVAQVLEDNPDREVWGTQDHGLLRMIGNPENEYGFATLEAKEPDPAVPLAIIGHPGIPTPDGESHTSYKTVAIPGIQCVTGGDEVNGSNDITYNGVRIYGGSSGAGVWDTGTGRLIGVNRASGRACTGGNGRANTILRHHKVSEWLDTDHGSGRMYSFTDAGLTKYNFALKNWRSSWHHLVPGNYRGRATQEMLFYDSHNGEAQFYVLTSGGITRLGPAHTGLNAPDSPWGQIVPVQIDDTPQQELLFLNTRTGSYRFYRTDGAGSLELLPPPGGRARVPVLGAGGTAPRLAVAGDFTAAAGTELGLYFPLEGRLELFGASAAGELSGLSTVATDLPVSSVLLAGEFRAASARQEVLLYDPNAQQVRTLWFDGTGTIQVAGPVDVPGGMATQLVVGAFPHGANLLAYQPSESNVYENVSGDTGKLSYFTLSDGSTLTPRLVEPGHRKTISKFVVGDFLTDGVPNAVMYDRYRL